MPVLPLVASTTVWPGRSSPVRSARSITASAMRSLTEPIGLKDSIFTYTFTPGGASLPSLTSGVLPIVSRMLSKRAIGFSSHWLRPILAAERGSARWRQRGFFGSGALDPGTEAVGASPPSCPRDRLVRRKSGTTIRVMAALELKFLGGLEILRDGASIELPPSKKTRALLAYLALNGRPFQREHLCDL